MTKPSFLLALLLALATFTTLTTACVSRVGATKVTGVPIACRLDALTPTDRAREGELLREDLSRVLETRERSDGYSFRYPADPALFVRIAELASLEHRCCPFLDFQLEWRGSEDSPWLHVTGGARIKPFVMGTFQTRDDGR